MRRLALLAVLAGSLVAPAHAVPPPDPQRFSNEILVLELSTALAPKDGILFYGSSSIRMWHDRLALDFGMRVVIGRGFGGSTMSDAEFWFERLVVPLHPSVIVLYEGDNDIEMGRTPDEVVHDFGRLVDRLREHAPWAHLVVLSIKPSPARWSKWPAMKATNARLAAQCDRNPERLTYVDVGATLLGKDGRPRPELYLADQLHLAPAAYDRWRDALLPVLNDLERKQLRRWPRRPLKFPIDPP